MYAVSPIVDRQFNSRKKADSFLAGSLTQGLELVVVELVVVCNNAAAYVLLLELLHILRDELIVLAAVGEFLVGSRMQVKIGPDPLRAVWKECP